MKPVSYLDYNATSPLRPEALAVMSAVLQETGNPSSVHGFGRNARRHVDIARQQVALRVGARSENVIFTASGTEANNLALLNAGNHRLLVSAIEHDSILKPARQMGAEIIQAQRSGEIDLDHLASLLQQDARPALVSIMMANNETGVIQPVAAISELVHRHGGLLHVDAAQAMCRIAVDISLLDIDFLTLSGHKIGGPQGVGALVLGRDREMTALLLGGGQERGRRAGSENVAAIAGFGAAAMVDTGAELARISALRDHLEAQLQSLGQPITFFGRSQGMALPQSHERLPNTSCFASGSKNSETLVMALDLAGVAVSAGSACSSGKVRPSHVITAMGFGAATAGTAIRVSLGWQSSQEDVERFVAAWSSIQTRQTGAAEAAGSVFTAA
ncbi:MAG TPA: cysteine desulfurase family protein [Terriglobales bacterium]|nr:cysteine desulfurase family protein [Terriglobales bacterium]